MKILKIVDYKRLIDTTKKALETKADKVIVFNLADVKNKDYQFVIDNYKILGEDLEAKKLKVLINGKVMKPCNLQGEEAESGYFLFGVESGDIFLDDITIQPGEYLSCVFRTIKNSEIQGIFASINTREDQ